jgi:hypothetical protein
MHQDGMGEGGGGRLQDGVEGGRRLQDGVRGERKGYRMDRGERGARLWIERGRGREGYK